MTHFTLRSFEIPLATPKAEFVRIFGRYVVARIADLNRYMDAATHVHSAQKQDPKGREESWEGPL